MPGRTMTPFRSPLGDGQLSSSSEEERDEPMPTHQDAAALRARVREAGAGTLELRGNYDPFSFGGAELPGSPVRRTPSW